MRRGGHPAQVRPVSRARDCRDPSQIQIGFHMVKLDFHQGTRTSVRVHVHTLVRPGSRGASRGCMRPLQTRRCVPLRRAPRPSEARPVARGTRRGCMRQSPPRDRCQAPLPIVRRPTGAPCAGCAGSRNCLSSAHWPASPISQKGDSEARLSEAREQSYVN